MHDRKRLLSQFEPPLTASGAMLGVFIAAYLFSGMFLLGVGNCVAGAVMLAPMLPLAAAMALNNWRTSLVKYPRLGWVLGIANAALLVVVLAFIGAQIYALSTV